LPAVNENPSPPAIRASDAERRQVIHVLRDAVVEGRLTLEEYSDRVGVAVGARTDQELGALTNDLPRAWDQYLGTTRVQRARAFQEALHQLGARSVLVAFRGERHVLSPDMAASACSFLRGLDLEQSEPHTVDPGIARPPHTRGHF